MSAFVEGIVSDDALTLLPQCLIGTYGLPTLLTSGVFKLGEGGWQQSPAGKIRRTPVGSLRRLDNNIQDIDAVVDTTRAVPDQRYLPAERYVYTQSFVAPDISYVAPYIQCRCLVPTSSILDDGFGNTPEFYEVGIFTDHPVTAGQKLMLAYGTFPVLSPGTTALELYVRILFGRL